MEFKEIYLKKKQNKSLFEFKTKDIKPRKKIRSNSSKHQILIKKVELINLKNLRKNLN